MSAPAPSLFTPTAKAMAEKLGLKMGRANLDEFATTLEELAKANPNIVAVTSDSRGSGKLGPFGKALPKQIVEVGIAEQNLVGITAGLAASSIITAMIGTETTPFNMAAPISAFIESMPERSISTPSTVATVRMA